MLNFRLGTGRATCAGRQCSARVLPAVSAPSHRRARSSVQAYAASTDSEVALSVASDTSSVASQTNGEAVAASVAQDGSATDTTSDDTPGDSGLVQRPADSPSIMLQRPRPRVRVIPDRSEGDAAGPAKTTDSPEASSSRSNGDAEDNTPLHFPYAVGDEVVGKVLFSHMRGARIAVQDCPGVFAFMPKNRGPYAIRSAQDTNPYSSGEFGAEGCIPKGMTRKFKVISVPDDMRKGGKGPLLAANDVDLKLIWGRLTQILKLGQEQRETVRVQVHGAAERGLLVTLLGVRGFIPISHVPKPEGSWLQQEDLQAYVGKDVEVSLMTVSQKDASFTCSIVNGASNKALRQLKIGSLLWGTVRLVRDYGVFMAIEGTFESALLHITNVSWERVGSLDEVFKVGDRVRAVVIGMDEGFSRLSVSTRDLEKTEGDMLVNKEAVYAGAEENVQRFLDHVAEWEAQEAQEP